MKFKHTDCGIPIRYLADDPDYAVLMELKRTLEEEREKMIERAEMDALCNGTGTVKVKEPKVSRAMAFLKQFLMDWIGVVALLVLLCLLLGFFVGRLLLVRWIVFGGQ